MTKEYISRESLLDLIEEMESCEGGFTGLCGHEVDVFTTGTEVTGAYIDGTTYITYEAQEADNV